MLVGVRWNSQWTILDLINAFHMRLFFIFPKFLAYFDDFLKKKTNGSFSSRIDHCENPPFIYQILQLDLGNFKFFFAKEL